MTPRLKSAAVLHTPRVRQEIATFFAQQRKDAKKIGPHLVHSIDVLEEFVMRGGKGIRSLLVILGYRIGGGKNDEVYKVAAGVEVFHKHLLNIDDIADRDERRYNRPTLWNAYEQEFAGQKDAVHHGRTMAEIDGTLLGSFAFELVRSASAFSPEILLDVIGIMDTIMYRQTVAGWQIQYFQNLEPLAAADEALFLQGLELVSAEYTFVAPIKIGLILAGAQHDGKIAQPIEKYAHAVGIAFQIQDDILGLFGDPKETGKPVGNDVREGKKTLLLQRAYRAANTDDREFLADVCGRELKVGELERIQEIVKITGSLEYSQKLAKEYVENGLKELKKLPQSEEVALLTDLAQFVVSRNV